MNRLLRAGFSPGAIFKLLKSWKVDLPVEEMSGEDDDHEDLPEF